MSAGQSIQDEVLVLRCREGDPAALDELLRRWQEPLWQYAVRLTGTEDAAWDVLQEAWVAIARDLPRLEKEAAFAVWAYRIVGNKARQWLRQHIRRRERENRYAEETQEEFADGSTPATAAVREALHQMPSADQMLLTLRFEEGFSMNELAQVLGVPAGTVKSRLHLAKERLRRLVEKDL
jgi:RNA polymerase sigma-70 factor (ECF subfamily)